MPDSDKREIKESYTELSAALKKGKGEQIEEIIESYTKLPRELLRDKNTVVVSAFREVAGSKAADVITNALHLGVPEFEKFLKLCEDPHTREFIRSLNLKYSLMFEGFFSPYPDDWYRLTWRTSYDFENKSPMINIQVLKRNGETIQLESPIDALLRLMKFQLIQIQKLTTHLDKNGVSYSIKSELEEIRTRVDLMLQSKQK